MPALLPSELPVRIQVRHHWIILFRRPSLLITIIFLVLFVLAVAEPWPMVVPFLIIFGVFWFLRWQTWRAERIILTQKRIVRVSGVPETTTQEASLRLDRISGAVVMQTVPGKFLDYATIELEATGNHPDTKQLVRIERPYEFYLILRQAILGDADDPVHLTVDDEGIRYPDEHETVPLPGRDPRRDSRQYRSRP